MSVTTVLGDIPASKLGITLAHEHLLLDLRNQYTDPEEERARGTGRLAMSRERAELVRDNPYALRDNLLLDDVDLAVAEAELFRELGGRSMVDCTCRGINPRPLDLVKIAQGTGLNIIAGCGYYTHDTHPGGLAERTAQDIAEEMVRDLSQGIAGTGVRAGVIGEVGTSHPIRAGETRVLEAAAIAHAQTGKAIYVHTFPWGRDGVEAARTLLKAGADPGKVVICHVDVDLDMDYLRGLLGMGVYVEFDNMGKEFRLETGKAGFATGGFATDEQRIRVLVELLDEGYGEQLLITTDICLKSMLVSYGGPGYGHVLANVVPRLLQAGVEKTSVDGLLVSNPARLLDS